MLLVHLSKIETLDFSKTTEQSSLYNNLESMSAIELLTHINNEDKKVALAVEKASPQILALVEQIVPKLKQGGRLFYMGAGTSGRLGVLDASECPPTFGVPHELVVGIIAGGERAIRKAVENAEDNSEQGWLDLQSHTITTNDVVIGIAASGTTPYVLGALKKANEEGIITGCITMNENSPLHLIAKHPIVATVGPEFVTGSSRMKAGTAQKLILNMISTATMVLLGKVKGNKMVDMKLSNSKLIDRANRMVVDSLDITYEEAAVLLEKFGNVRNVLDNYKK